MIDAAQQLFAVSGAEILGAPAAPTHQRRPHSIRPSEPTDRTAFTLVGPIASTPVSSNNVVGTFARIRVDLYTHLLIIIMPGRFCHMLAVKSMPCKS